MCFFVKKIFYFNACSYRFKIDLSIFREYTIFSISLKGYLTAYPCPKVWDFDTFNIYFLPGKGVLIFFFKIVKIPTLCSNLPLLELDIDI